MAAHQMGPWEHTTGTDRVDAQCSCGAIWAWIPALGLTQVTDLACPEPQVPAYIEQLKSLMAGVQYQLNDITISNAQYLYYSDLGVLLHCEFLRANGYGSKLWD